MLGEHGSGLLRHFHSKQLSILIAVPMGFLETTWTLISSGGFNQLPCRILPPLPPLAACVRTKPRSSNIRIEGSTASGLFDACFAVEFVFQCHFANEDVFFRPTTATLRYGLPGALAYLWVCRSVDAESHALQSGLRRNPLRAGCGLPLDPHGRVLRPDGFLITFGMCFQNSWREL